MSEIQISSDPSADAGIEADAMNSEAEEQPVSDTGDTLDPDPPARLSPHLQRRRRRDRLNVAAGVLAVVFVLTVLWSHGYFDKQSETPVLAIAPRVLFEQLCWEAKKEQATKLHVTDFEVNDSMIELMRGLDSIETLIIDRGIVNDEAIATIAGLPKLQHLRLRLSPIGDDGLKLLSQVPSLWYVNLPHAECTAEGVGHLAAIPRLRQLRLGSPNLGNEVTHEIAKIKTLRGIHLIGVAVTDEGLKTLASMPRLESLYLDDSAVTEEGWDWLFRQHPHLHVHVDQSHHDRDPQAHQHH